MKAMRLTSSDLLKMKRNQEKIVAQFHEKREDLLKLISNIDFQTELTPEILSDLKDKLESLDTEILDYFDEVSTQYEYIEQIVQLLLLLNYYCFE